MRLLDRYHSVTRCLNNRNAAPECPELTDFDPAGSIAMNVLREFLALRVSTSPSRFASHESQQGDEFPPPRCRLSAFPIPRTASLCGPSPATQGSSISITPTAICCGAAGSSPDTYGPSTRRPWSSDRCQWTVRIVVTGWPAGCWTTSPIAVRRQKLAGSRRRSPPPTNPRIACSPHSRDGAGRASSASPLR